MTQDSIIITPPAASHREQPTSTLVRIMRGICAVLPLDSINSNPWDVWEAVARARMYAVDASHKHSSIFHLCRTELLTTVGDSRLVPKPSRYHLPGQPKMHFFSPFVPRRLHDGSSDISVML